MAFCGIVTKSIVAELNNCLIGARVNKIFEPNKNEIILSLYNNENYTLDINIHPDNYRMNLTKYTKPNPINAMNYCMLLRKYLVGLKIRTIKSFDLERIVKIYFEGSNELKDQVSFCLVVELMGRRSNVILLNEKNVIIDSLKHIVTSAREILPARPYEYPELFKVSLIDLGSFESFSSMVLIDAYENVSKCIADKFVGISEAFVNNILSDLDIEKSTRDLDDLRLIYEYILDLISKLGTNAIKFKKINAKDYTVELDHFPSGSNYEPSLEINEAIDELYRVKEITDNFDNQKNNLLKMILSSLKKCSKKIENINRKLEECENMDMYRLYGELLTANLYKYTSLDYTPEEIEVENYHDNNNLIKIKLDTSCSVQKNMEKFYKKYNKLKNTLAVVTGQKKEAELELQYIESIVFSLNSCDSLEEVEEIRNEFLENVSVKKISYKNLRPGKKNTEEQIHLNKYDINGFEVYVGKNNRQNDYLTLHFASKDDLWFHIQSYSGSHVILKTNGREPDEDTIFKCAVLAKQNSKASLSKNVSVDYTYIKFVRKAPGQKPGMVNYINYKTIIL